MLIQCRDCVHGAALNKQIAIVLKVSPFSMQPCVLMRSKGRVGRKFREDKTISRACS